LQEVVHGRLMAISTLMDRDGSVIAQEQQRSERIWPPDAGVSARARTVPLDEELARRVAAMLRSIGWYGLAQVQFVVGDDGVPRMIDLNPRFYGSLALAISSGTDFPALWAAMATGRPLPPVVSRTGVRYHWLGGDLRRALRERRGGLLRDVASCFA